MQKLSIVVLLSACAAPGGGDEASFRTDGELDGSTRFCDRGVFRAALQVGEAVERATTPSATGSSFELFFVPPSSGLWQVVVEGPSTSVSAPRIAVADPRECNAAGALAGRGLLEQTDGAVLTETTTTATFRVVEPNAPYYLSIAIAGAPGTRAWLRVHDRTPVHDPCALAEDGSEHDCTTCTSLSGCGYCDGVCRSGDAGGPSDCADWRWISSECGLAAFGEPCVEDFECDSGRCGWNVDLTERACTSGCAGGGTCPEGYSCLPLDGGTCIKHF